MDASIALVRLSALAADFKLGIVPDSLVRDILESIVGSMDLSPEARSETLRLAMRCWGMVDD